MHVIRSIKKMQSLARAIAGRGETIGLVPTMGYLHEGHLSLIHRARKKADVVITTVFVNPTQFAPGEDLRRYPRDERGDLRKIESAGGDVVFIPKAAAMYPADFQTSVTVAKLTQGLEGTARPAHFQGVTTVVAKLFNICRPDLAVFGMKDFQQAVVLRQMAADLGYPIKLVIAPTIRESDGLAMSSRNAYFSPPQRVEALCLYYALRTARSMVMSGMAETRRIKREMLAAIEASCPTASVDYIAFSDYATLQPQARVKKGTICSLAVTVHGVRLIDNMKLL